jgi:hypothetical protein
MLSVVVTEKQFLLVRVVALEGHWEAGCILEEIGTMSVINKLKYM